MTVGPKMVESVSSLDTLTRWEYGEYASAAVVILGVVGEFLADFSNVWRVRDVPDRRDKLRKLSTLVLIAGLAAELVCLVSTNVVSGHIIASLGRQAAEAIATAKRFEAQIASASSASTEAVAEVKAAEARIAEARRAASEADARAAEAGRMAEAERLERIKLEAIVAPRSLSLDQQRLIAAACGRFHGHAVLVSSYGMDGEGAALGEQIMSALRSAGVVVADNRGASAVSGGFDVGVHVRGPDAEHAFISILGNALSSIGRLKVMVNDPPPKLGAMIFGGGQSFPAGTVFVTVMVGVKPVPILPAPK
jgi:hypothetical protein